MLMKHNLKLFRQNNNKNVNVFFEKKIIVTEYSTDNSRFDLKFKINTEFSVSQWSSIISKAALFTWKSAWEQKSVSVCQHMCSEKPVSVYNNSLPALTCWAEQISILSWLWLHVYSIQAYWILHLWSSITLSHQIFWLLLTAHRAIFIMSWSQEPSC